MLDLFPMGLAGLDLSEDTASFFNAAFRQDYDLKRSTPYS